MTSNPVNATLPQAEVDKILAGIAALRQSLPFLIDLSAEERQGRVKFGEKNLSFVMKTLALAEQHGEILPATFKLDDLRTTIALYQALYPVALSLEHFMGQVQDTLFAAGSAAYTEGLHIYTYAKAANLITGSLEDALNDLGRHFARHPHAAKPADTTH